MIRGKVSRSQYYGGGYRKYGKYQWDIKYYWWESDYEIEAAVQWAFGDRVRNGANPHTRNTVYGFDGISELLGRPIASSIAGRSGGWLVIDTELTQTELERMDEFVEGLMAGLPQFLRDEREYYAAEVAAENTHHAED